MPADINAIIMQSPHLIIHYSLKKAYTKLKKLQKKYFVYSKKIFYPCIWFYKQKGIKDEKLLTNAMIVALQTKKACNSFIMSELPPPSCWLSDSYVFAVQLYY
jgi:hypothetical protein